MARLAESLGRDVDAVRSILEKARTETTKKTFKEDGGGLERVVLKEGASGKYTLWLCPAHVEEAMSKDLI